MAKTERQGVRYSVADARSKEAKALLDEDNDSQRAMVYRAVSKGAESFLDVLRAVGRGVKGRNVSSHLSKLKADGLLVAERGKAIVRAAARLDRREEAALPVTTRGVREMAAAAIMGALYGDAKLMPAALSREEAWERTIRAVDDLQKRQIGFKP